MRSEANRIPWLAIVVIAVTAFAAGIGLSHLRGGNSGAAAVDGLLWPDPPRIDAIALQDQAGQPFRQDALSGHWTLVFFGFTHCPDVCPVTLEMLARAHTELQTHSRYGERGQVVFISVDPERDTPAVINDYVRYFAPDLIGATGAPDELARLTRQMGVLYMKVDQGEAAYSVDHSAGIFFIDPELRLVSVLTPPHTVAAIVQRFDAVSAFIEAQ